MFITTEQQQRDLNRGQRASSGTHSEAPHSSTEVRDGNEQNPDNKTLSPMRDRQVSGREAGEGGTKNTTIHTRIPCRVEKGSRRRGEIEVSLVSDSQG